MNTPHATATVSAVIHLVWGASILVLAAANPLVAQVQPALVVAWVGTAVMLGLATLVLAANGWPRRGHWFLPALLLPDAAALLLVTSLR